MPEVKSFEDIRSKVGTIYGTIGAQWDEIQVKVYNAGFVAGKEESAAEIARLKQQIDEMRRPLEEVPEHVWQKVRERYSLISDFNLKLILIALNADRAYIAPPGQPETPDKQEAAELQLIDERDEAEQAMSQAYYLVTGRSPEWSNNFGYEQALEDIKDSVNLFKDAARPKPDCAVASASDMCECKICGGEGFVGTDGSTCACIIAGCRMRHGRDAYLPPKRPFHPSPAPSPVAIDAMRFQAAFEKGLAAKQTKDVVELGDAFLMLIQELRTSAGKGT